MASNRQLSFTWAFNRGLVLGLLAWLLGGCAGDSSMKFYMLNAETGQTPNHLILSENGHVVVGLGPIRLPDYLDRPQIVVAVGDNQYRLDEQHRWAERLDRNMGRALALLLAEQRGVEQIVRFPWPQKQTIDYQVSIDVLQFHQTAGGVSRLEAQWQIKNRDEQVLGRRFDCGIPAKDEADAIVKAQSQCLGRLGLDIVTGLRQMANEAGSRKWEAGIGG